MTRVVHVRPLSFAGLLIGFAWPALPAQDQDQPIVTEAKVTECVGWLASDERLGRDSPSPGLEVAATWIEQRFEAAGLEPGVQGQWRQRYELPGQRLDSRSLELRIEISQGDQKQSVVLSGDKDVRLLRPAEVAEGSSATATVVRASDPRLARWLGTGGGRIAAVLEVAEDDPFWLSTAGVREFLSRRLRGSAPVFLVRRGLLPTVATVSADTEPVCSLTWKGAAGEAVAVELANVVGILHGTAKPEEYVIVSAHYDHIGLGVAVDGDVICNGADDDATGTTAVVLLAAELAHRPRQRRSIAFVCFSAEEKGLRGSQAFAEHPPFPLDATVANVNIEMIGRPEPGRERSAWITGRDYSDFAAIAAAALHRGGIEVVEFEQAMMLFAQSDNLSLARKGVVAHSISAGSLHADYHRPTDEVAKLDIAHMTAVIRGLAEVVVEFAGREQRPAYNDAGKAFLGQLRGR